MATTLAKLKIGSRIVFGSYAPAVWPGRFGDQRKTQPSPIRWIKCGRGGLLISEYVIDYLAFDETENRGLLNMTYGNPAYVPSNIHQYLNADGEEWFRPSDTYDARPKYADCQGFLSLFTGEELSVMCQHFPYVNGSYDERPCLVRLPSFYEIFSDYDTVLPYFKRYGRRAYPSDQLRRLLIGHYSHYFSYRFADSSDERNNWSISGSGNLYRWNLPCVLGGIRPMIFIDPDTEFSPDDGGIYYPILKTTQNCELADPLSELFGL